MDEQQAPPQIAPVGTDEPDEAGRVLSAGAVAVATLGT
jgi:hypothetical protein